MTPPVFGNMTTRPASHDDIDFMRTSYLATQKPLLEKLPHFDEEALISRFQKSLLLDDVEIVLVDDQRAGWLQLTRTPDLIEVAQLHIMPDFQNQKIGSTLVQHVLEEASSTGKRAKLAVIKGNPALALYQRLGFEIYQEDAIKHHLQWLPRQAI